MPSDGPLAGAQVPDAVTAPATNVPQTPVPFSAPTDPNQVTTKPRQMPSGGDHQPVDETPKGPGAPDAPGGGDSIDGGAGPGSPTPPLPDSKVTSAKIVAMMDKAQELDPGLSRREAYLLSKETLAQYPIIVQAGFGLTINGHEISKAPGSYYATYCDRAPGGKRRYLAKSLSEMKQVIGDHMKGDDGFCQAPGKQAAKVANEWNPLDYGNRGQVADGPITNSVGRGPREPRRRVPYDGPVAAPRSAPGILDGPAGAPNGSVPGPGEPPLEGQVLDPHGLPHGLKPLPSGMDNGKVIPGELAVKEMGGRAGLAELLPLLI